MQVFLAFKKFTSAADRRSAPRQNQVLARRYLLLILAAGTILLVGSEHAIGQALALSTHQQTIDDNTFATTQLGAPGDLTASPLGHTVQLAWSAGQAGTGYSVRGAASASSNCTGVSFSNLDTTSNLDYVDSNRYSPQGTWFCYQIITTRGGWSSQQSNPVMATRLGFFAADVQLINGGDTSACGNEQYGVNEDLDCGDQISVTFNQPVDVATGPGSGDTVCADDSSGTIWLGSTDSAVCTSNENARLGRLTGGTIENGGSRFAASYEWSPDRTILIVTVGTLVSGSVYPTLSSGAWTLMPTTNTDDLLSDAGGYHICDSNTDGGNCWPEASWTGASFYKPDSAIDVPLATPTPIDSLSSTDPAPTEAPLADGRSRPTPTATSTLTPTPTPTSEPPISAAEPTLDPFPTATPLLLLTVP